MLKYVHKRVDRAIFKVLDNKQGEQIKIGETKEYIDARYLCTNSGIYRLFGGKLTYHYPTVVSLAVHLDKG